MKWKRIRLQSSIFHSDSLAILFVVEVPGVRDHQLEVLVVVNTCGNMTVIVEELVQSDLSISLLGVLISNAVHCAMRLEGLEELLEYLFLCLLASSHVWMLPRVVALPHIVDVDVAVFIEIQLLEYSLDQVLSEWTHVSLDGVEQLVERNETIIVDVEQVEELTALLLAELEAEVTESLPELLYFERSIAIVVQDLEYSLQTDQSSCTSGSQLLPQFGHQFVVFVLDAGVSRPSVSRGTKLILVGVLVVDRVLSSCCLTGEDLVAAHGGLGRRLPVLSSLLLGEWSLSVGTEEVPVMVSSVSLSCVDVGHLLRCAGVGHTRWIGATFETPCIRNHQVKVGVVLDVARYVVVIFDELFEGHFAVSAR